jgi:succinate dehydrogenase / fumarate reductase, iron-sulfur subunit
LKTDAVAGMVRALTRTGEDVWHGCVDLKSTHGVDYCNITKCCTKVCPEGITITDNAIIPLKKRVIDQLYDPVAKLFRMLRHAE